MKVDPAQLMDRLVRSLNSLEGRLWIENMPRRYHVGSGLWFAICCWPRRSSIGYYRSWKVSLELVPTLTCRWRAMGMRRSPISLNCYRPPSCMFIFPMGSIRTEKIFERDMVTSTSEHCHR